jgi:hypothetical protein
MAAIRSCPYARYVNSPLYLARRRRMGVPLLLALVALVVLAAPPSASAEQVTIIGGAGKRGTATLWQGTCKYRIFVRTGLLVVGVPTPTVTGANTRRRTRRERTFVRYRVDATDAFNDFSRLVTSSWSDYIQVRQSETGTWTGEPTTFDMDWRGNYGADIRVEWWNSKRMIGWRVYRLSAFQFFDQYNVGPFGPISSCYKYTVY